MAVPKKDFLWQYVEHWAGIDPGFPALRTDRETLNYGDFERRSDLLAASFLALGLGKGDTIATMLPTSIEFILTLIAADKIGAIVTALDVKYKSADLKRFISHIEPGLIVSLGGPGSEHIPSTVQSACGDLDLPRQPRLVVAGVEGPESFDGLFSGEKVEDTKLAAAKKSQHPDDGLLVVFTGGTTGVPKAALLSKRNVAAMAAVEMEYLGRFIPGRIKSIASLPPSHVGGTVELIGAPLTGGLEVILHDTWSPQRVLATTQAENVPWMGGVPAMFAITLLMPDLDSYDLSCLKVVVMSGEKVEPEFLQLVREKICPNILIGYGSTEAGSELTFTDPDDDVHLIGDGYVGKPLPGVELKIVDDGEREIHPGETGEVLARSPFTIKGYYKMPEEDRAGFTADGFCRTGDLGYLTPEGGLYIKGRKKHIIRVGSYTVMPSEVEEVIAGVPGVGMSAVIGVPDKVLGEVVWAVVQPFPGQTITEEQVIEQCEAHLAKFKIPKKVIFRDELPLTRIGKVHRVEIQNETIASMKKRTVG